ncbi:hypothetical protein Sango_1056500 [Sesamum angolense]|uniref:Reverse transcriptase domain-containing protein n=1 Tax=Sesamum angolense TaxID=2727404 RepID=A0AAE2BZ61_9LAMI|nr:hypothetical protein Sango_1056500 [Sesamum angolense]
MILRGDGGETPCHVDVEYEWVPSKCCSCNSLGHQTNKCPSAQPSRKPPISIYVQRLPAKKPKVLPPQAVEPKIQAQTPVIEMPNEDLTDGDLNRDISPSIVHNEGKWCLLKMFLMFNLLYRMLGNGLWIIRVMGHVYDLHGNIISLAVIREEVTRAILDFFDNGHVLKQAITKILVHRIREVMDRLISPSQNAFMLDFRKAYDTVEWDFLIAVMRLFGFSEVLIRCEECVTTPTFSIYINGARHDFFKGTRRLRQGDPMSPYLFVPVMELILSKAAHIDRTRLLEVLGFQEGHLPITYLDLPLISSRTSLANCRPLLMKIDNRIQGWGELLEVAFLMLQHMVYFVLKVLSVALELSEGIYSSRGHIGNEWPELIAPLMWHTGTCWLTWSITYDRNVIDIDSKTSSGRCVSLDIVLLRNINNASLVMNSQTR